MIIRLFMTALMAAALSSCASSYSFKVGAFPTNVAPHESGWQYLAQVTIQDHPNSNATFVSNRKCIIKVIDAHRKVLLSEVIEVQGGKLEPSIEWQEGPLLLVGISSPLTAGTAPLFEAQYRPQGSTFQRTVPSP